MSESTSTGSDSSSFSLPQAHYTRQRLLPSLQTLRTQKCSGSAARPSVPTLSDSDSDWELPQEHFTRKRLIPSFHTLKSQRSLPTREINISEPDDLPFESDNDLPSDTPSGSSYRPSSPEVQFHGPIAGVTAEPSVKGKWAFSMYFAIVAWFLNCSCQNVTLLTLAGGLMQLRISTL